MSTTEKATRKAPTEASLFDPEGFPWLENGERLDQKTFHERYEKTPPGFKAEFIEGTVYLQTALSIRHGRALATLGGWLFLSMTRQRAKVSGTLRVPSAISADGTRSVPATS
ncbi:hypothetical protein BH23PLA1_BH23PLA1_15010 [soil metagenome]